ncbi:hypothetical protein ABGB19_05275 [Mycobacterium sp. B14F4]|uniref:hypothetical protein n=1 Tax=Mycobacterium sp. B14F4 TaxID=3153565 RepID=UPI00325F8BCC
MAAVSTATYVRGQATVAAVVNVLVNPAIDWLSNRDKGALPLWAADGLVVNFAATSLILSVLVAVFATLGIRHRHRPRRIAVPDRSVSVPRWLIRLPGRGWLLGLALGAAAALLAVAAAFAFHTVGVSTLSLAWLLAVKAAFAGVLAFFVARWTILRQLAG